MDGDINLSRIVQKQMQEARGLSKKQTNADRIRAMSDEELADYLYRMALCSLTTVKIDNKEIAIPKLLKWLQSEAE